MSTSHDRSMSRWLLCSASSMSVSCIHVDITLHNLIPYETCSTSSSLLSNIRYNNLVSPTSTEFRHYCIFNRISIYSGSGHYIRASFHTDLQYHQWMFPIFELAYDTRCLVDCHIWKEQFGICSARSTFIELYLPNSSPHSSPHSYNSLASPFFSFTLLKCETPFLVPFDLQSLKVGDCVTSPSQNGLDIQYLQERWSFQFSLPIPLKKHNTVGACTSVLQWPVSHSHR